MNKIMDVCTVSDRYSFDLESKSFIKIGVSQIESRHYKPEDQDSSDSKNYQTSYPEGGVYEVSVEMRYRNQKLSKDAKKKFGYTCCICGFNSQRVYGDLGKDYIEVHHLEPLSRVKDKHSITIDKVAVVCANCHRTLHSTGDEPLKLDILRKKVIERRRVKRKNRKYR